MAKFLQDREAAPMIEINTTPLIDVMLVLLIMFIITVPLQSHAVKIDLPQQPPNPAIVNPVKNKIVVTAADQILWNGEAISDARLSHALAMTQRLRPIPELHLQPEGAARYEVVDEVLVLTKRAGVANMGFVGNEAYGTF